MAIQHKNKPKENPHVSVDGWKHKSPKTAKKLQTSRKNLSNARNHLSTIGREAGAGNIRPGESLPDYHQRVVQSAQKRFGEARGNVEKLQKAKKDLAQAEGWADEYGRLYSNTRMRAEAAEKGMGKAQSEAARMRGLKDLWKNKNIKNARDLAEVSKVVSAQEIRITELKRKGQITDQDFRSRMSELEAQKGRVEMYQRKFIDTKKGLDKANANIENRKRVSKDRRDLTRNLHSENKLLRSLLKKGQLNHEEMTNIFISALDERFANININNLSQTQINQMSQSIVQQINQSLGHTHLTIGEGGVIQGLGGMPLIYNPVQGVGGGMGEGRGLSGRATLDERMFEELSLTDREKVAKGRFGIKEEKKEAAEEEKEPKGSEKFAKDAKNVGEGLGSINKGLTSLFDPAMMGNIFMVVAIVLLIYIVMQFFPMI